MQVFDTIEPARAWRRERGAARERVALVPTMGALHDGHRALIRRASQMAEAVVVSVYVNPTQFDQASDLTQYPRTLETDLEMCREEGVAAVFTPSDEAMYPEGHATMVDVPAMGEKLEGASRPGHFRGVCTVVLKLFTVTWPDVAVFGWKDAQQFLILRRMAADLHLPVAMEAIETVRESDGLAMSSRNRRLTPEQRAAAPALHRALQAGVSRVIAGARVVEKVEEAVREEIAKEPLIVLDRLDTVAMDTLEPLGRIAAGNTLIAIAVRLGDVRLIDNARV